MWSGIRRWALALRLRHARPQTRPSPYGLEMRISPNAKRRCAYLPRYRNQPHRYRSPDMGGGRGAVGFRLPGCNRARKPAHIREEGHATADAGQCGPHHPQSGATRGQGQQSANAARPGAAPAQARNSRQHKQATARCQQGGNRSTPA